MLLLPMALGGVAYVLNQSQEERPLRWLLTRHQLFNLEILKEFLKNKNLLAGRSPEALKQEITSHGWDIAVVEIALEDLKKAQAK